RPDVLVGGAGDVERFAGVRQAYDGGGTPLGDVLAAPPRQQRGGGVVRYWGDPSAEGDPGGLGHSRGTGKGPSARAGGRARCGGNCRRRERSMSDDLEALLREHYRRAADGIQPDAELIARSRDAARSGDTARLARTWPRVLIAAAAIAVIAALTWGLLKPG